MVSQEWQFIAKLSYPRSKPLVAVSHANYNIYISGGSHSRTGDNVIEYYSPRIDYWNQIEVNLDFRVTNVKTHMVVYNEDYMPARDRNNPGAYESDDKLLFVHYDNIVYPVPDIYFISAGLGVVEELKYDKTNSTVSTYFKKKMIYDKQTKQLIAFSGTDFLTVDFMDTTDEF